MVQTQAIRETKLDGMKEITTYFCRSESTILILIRDQAFPAKKIGGTWTSDKDLIDQWRRDLLHGRIELDSGKPKDIAVPLSSREAAAG